MARIHSSKFNKFNAYGLSRVESDNGYYHYYYLPVSMFTKVSKGMDKTSPTTYANDEAFLKVTKGDLLLITSKTNKDYENLKESGNLYEVKRDKLNSLAKKDTKARYERRLTIDIGEVKYRSMNAREFINNGNFNVDIDVRDYSVNLNFEEVVKYLKANKPKGKDVTYRMLQTQLGRALDNGDVHVNCTCPDFRYRFAYVASLNKYKSKGDELRPANITNPNNKGSMCKHLLYLSNNRKWIAKYVSLVNVIIKLNPDIMK